MIRIRLDRLELLGEGDIDLHGPASANRIPAFEQTVAEWHAANEVLVDVAELLLGLGGLDPLTIGSSIRGSQIESRLHQGTRHAGARGALADGAQRHSPQPR